ncbi:cytoskeleton bundling-enhancing protein CbeA [Candidatus Pantoea symbiotica]|uniref:Cytoskeleton bundling-enhancing protein CbeA n=1 Tax=Candidatus Pantoea symbiotica TaxID=1884370 RepID=A0A1I4BXD1_9GAMM|nr:MULTISPECIES: type IV toxin-antitoxin system YeeU family antitoxin [Pantoea]SFK73305.1 cytoskeleton bundling-enhancing protein CbeA [Pantoea symbiotica]SFV00553.1 cytoskeleton bundling-enhancing protein CbeA [Pantoea sp. YR525]
MNENEWGLKRSITPRFSVRLVQEGNRLHYLADRAGIVGEFSEEQIDRINQSFPQMIGMLEHLLATGELNPRQQHCITIYHNNLTCEADTLGSHGYVYIAVYPTTQ